MLSNKRLSFVKGGDFHLVDPRSKRETPQYYCGVIEGVGDVINGFSQLRATPDAGDGS